MQTLEKETEQEDDLGLLDVEQPTTFRERAKVGLNIAAVAGFLFGLQYGSAKVSDYFDHSHQVVYSIPLSHLETLGLEADRKKTYVVYDSPEVDRIIPLVVDQVSVENKFFGEKKVNFYINKNRSEWFLSGARWQQGKDPLKLPLKFDKEKMYLIKRP